MSYRLINANAISVRWPEVNDMPCIYADLPNGLDGGFYDMREPSKFQRENAKLRELVKMAWHCAHSALSCYDCRRITGDCTLQTSIQDLGIEMSALKTWKPRTNGKHMGDSILERVRELAIEV